MAGLGGMGVAELHGAAAENCAWRLRAAEEKEEDEEEGEARVASMISASTADLAGEHVMASMSESTMDSEFGHVYSTAASRLSDLEQSFPDFVKSATADAGHGEQETRRQRFAERRARLQEMYGMTPSENGLGCKNAPESLGQIAAAPTSQMTSCAEVTEADVVHSKSESTADSTKPASTADFDRRRSHRTPASPVYDLERFASVHGFRDFKKSVAADADDGEMETRRQRIVERRARLREKYGKTPSEHVMGFCSSDCIACKAASESLGQTAAAPTTQMNFRPAVTEAVMHSMSESTADSSKSASKADFHCELSYRTPSAPLFDLERLALVVYV
jgi:hypothetical protein